MNRTALPLALSFLALAACADKPANTASSAETTSARYPDGTVSSNVNDTSATGAATNESPSYPSHASAIKPSTKKMASTTPTTTSTTNATSATTSPSPGNGTRLDNAVPAHDVNRSADASSTNGTYGNAGGVPGAQPGVTAPPPPQNDSPKVTEVDQGNDSSDLKMTAKIRREVVGNSDLSFTAKNVKIITNGGHVTLKGEVKTQKERDAIQGTAERVAGPANVDDRIVVKP